MMKSYIYRFGLFLSIWFYLSSVSSAELNPFQFSDPTSTPTPTPTSQPIYPANSLDVEWKYYPANGHYYAIVFDRVSWYSASSHAGSMGGYLVTLLDENENEFVNNYVQSYGYSEFWMGLYREDRWRWVTGEGFEYARWAPGEPTQDGNCGMCCENGWNDSPSSFTPQCYVIEKDENVVSPTPTPIRPVAPVWHYNPTNGHSYTLVPGLKTVDEVEEKARELGAYVVSITDEREETWIQNTFAPYHYYAICLGLRFDGSEWRWFSGEPYGYSNFTPRQHYSNSYYAFKYINEANYGNQWSVSSEWAPYNAPTLFEKGDASPINYDWIYNPENGHYYAIVFEKNTWEYANQTAMEWGGYLVTIRSDSEAKWVRDLMFRYGFEETWMGLWKTEDWAWVTGEKLDYTGWLPGEPSGDGLCGMLRVYGWNDAPQWYTNDCFVIEKDRNLPSPTPTPSGPTEYRWMRNYANGHEYAIVPDIYSWEEGVRKANELGGYIVSITSKEEDDWIAGTFHSMHFRNVYIGLYWSEEQWKWASGEPVAYTNWLPSEPSYGDTHPKKFIFEDEYNYEWSADADWKKGAPAIIVERESAIPTPTAPQSSYDLEWIYNHANGHYYAIVFDRVTWYSASSHAGLMGGYLVTLLDENENEFVNQYVQSYGYSEFWIGLYRDDDWGWVTDEEFDYSHWASGEPSGDGNRGMCREIGWNDSPSSFTPQCYVIEKNENVVSPTPTDVGPTETEWHYNPENDHSYVLIPGLKTWEEVLEKALELGAYPASITTEKEEEWIQNTFSPYHYYAICMGLKFEETEWRWISGEPFEYSNWRPRQSFSGNAYGFKYINEANYNNQWSTSQQWSPYNAPTLFEKDEESLHSHREWVYNPENGHYYTIVFEKRSWQAANQIANDLGGYLVTIQSEREAKWVYSLTYRHGFDETWIGLHKSNIWEWITDEELVYTGWLPGEPNGDGIYAMQRYYGWNDASNNYNMDCFVVEKGGNAPMPTPTPSGPPEYHWIQNSANGHYYAIVPDIASWEEGVQKAVELGGYIVSVNSKEEDDWITETFSSSNFRNIFIGLIKINDKWSWMSGEPIIYTNWFPGEPKTGENYVEKYMYKGLLNNQWAGKRIWTEEAPVIVVEREWMDATPTPTPHARPIAEFDLNGGSLEENGFWAGAPIGYTMGDVSFGEIPDVSETGGRGLRIELAPGEGVFAFSNQTVDASGLADVCGRIRASHNNISLALIALNDDLDGQYGYSNLLYQEIPVKDYRDVHLIYSAPSGKLRVALQAVNPAYNSQNTTVWADRLSVAPYDMESELASMEDALLEVNGSFDGGLGNLLFNVNDADGSVAPFFQSHTDAAIRMMLDPFHRAANVGTTCLDIYDKFPFRLLGWTTVKRDSMPGRGTASLVITNGMQDLGVFRLADELRDANDPEDDYLTVGGDFTVNNPDAPVFVFVQLGGPGANASIVVDDLVIVKSRKGD